MSVDRTQITLEDLGLQPRTYAEPVSDLVRQLVAQLQLGSFRPGSKLPPERKLAEVLGVGRSTLREALKTLSVLGLLEIRPGDGTYLSPQPANLLPQIIEWGLLLGSYEATALIEARAELEVVIAELGAQRAGESDTAFMSSAVEHMNAAKSDEDFVNADIEFHMALASACGNPVLAGILRNVKSLLKVWVVRAISVMDREEVIQQHNEIITAVREGDPVASREAMVRHMGSVTHCLIHTLDIERRA